jgi:DNA-binding transcriptional MerR regulator
LGGARRETSRALHQKMKQLLTIGQFARRFGISRSTVLYYDKLKLLQASARSESGYRLFGTAEVRRMEQITTLREAGLPLSTIAEVLASGSSSTTKALESRLRRIQSEIKTLRDQQRLIGKLIGDRQMQAGVMTKERWVRVLRSSGMDDRDMDRWHAEFEKHDGQAHQDFLESLGMTEEEIAEVRKLSSAAEQGRG